MAVIVGVAALIPAVIDTTTGQNSDLSIVEIKATTKDDVSVSVEDPAGRKSVGSPIVASAISIVLRNSGEEPALINRIKLLVDQVWAPGGCRGAGGVSYRVSYDFVLPGDIERGPLPYAAEIPSQFQVAGKELDGLLIPIGQERFGQGGWPLIVAGTLELTQDNGDKLKTEPFVLMDGQWNDDIVKLANETRGDGSREDPYSACVEKNLGMLRAALGRPGSKSSSINELLDRIKPKQVNATQGPEVTKPGERDIDGWVAQLASLPSSIPRAEVDKQAQEISANTGLSAQVLSSSDFGSLQPGYWFVYHAGGFKDGHAVLEVCKKVGRTDLDSCVGRYLSHREVDRDLGCYFSDPQDARRCRR